MGALPPTAPLAKRTSCFSLFLGQATAGTPPPYLNDRKTKRDHHPATLTLTIEGDRERPPPSPRGCNRPVSPPTSHR